MKSQLLLPEAIHLNHVQLHAATGRGERVYELRLDRKCGEITVFLAGARARGGRYYSSESCRRK